MKHQGKWYRSLLAGMALFAGLGIFNVSVFAQTVAGTASGTNITNTATLNYAISGTAQPSVAPAVATSFLVDNMVRVVVTEVGGTFTAVAPGATAQITTFTVANTGNTTQDYSLSVNGAIATGQTVTLGGTGFTDNNQAAAGGFDATGCNAFVETNAVAGYQAAGDVNRAIVSLPATAGTNTVTVYVVCNIPAAAGGAVNGNNALVALTATTANAATCTALTGAGCVTTTASAGADNPAAVDIVFADVAGSDDVARDGKHSARDVYQVAAAVISVSKAVAVVCDPLNFNGTGAAPITPAKSIPGAYMRYTLTITNAAAATASATLTDITDALNANTSFDPDLRTGAAATCATSPPLSAVGNGFQMSCLGAANTRACKATPVNYTTAGDTDAMSFGAGAVTIKFGAAAGVTGTQALPAEGTYAAGELKPNESVQIIFNVIIN